MAFSPPLSFSLCSILFRKEEERKTMNLWFCLGRRHTSCRKLFICMSTCLMSIGLSIYLSTYLHRINIYTTRYICMFAVSYCTCMHTWCLVVGAQEAVSEQRRRRGRNKKKGFACVCGWGIRQAKQSNSFFS